MPLPTIFLMGPTGAGKTQLALDLAERFPVEIVSVDSALVYRGLNVGSAKPNPQQLAQVRHHLIDLCDPSEAYSAAKFRADARQSIEAIRNRGRVPVLVGGTGLYFRALANGLAELPHADPEVRAALTRQLAERGSAAMHCRLEAIDPASAARIHPNDPQRILRALEVHQLSGETLSEIWQRQARAGLAGPVVKWVIAPTDKTRFQRRLERRFHDMLARGFVNEVMALRRRGDLSLELPALRAVGYREIWRYLAAEISEQEMTSRAIISTRQLAKRQLTWFRREADCQWFESDNSHIVEHLSSELKRLLSDPI